MGRIISINGKKLRSGAKRLGRTAKMVGYDFPKEVAKRTISQRYVHKRVFGEDLPK